MDDILKGRTRLNRLTLNRALHATNERILGDGVSRMSNRVIIEQEDVRTPPSAFRIPIVSRLPTPRDKTKVYIVYWAHSSEIPDANGDGQLWCWSHRHRSWYPMMFPSDLSWENIADPEMEEE